MSITSAPWTVGMVTKEDGSVAERRSYDPSGQRRRPVRGEPVPASFDSLNTLGFTGHEGDEELHDLEGAESGVRARVIAQTPIVA